jgi:hypothetical protein
MTPNEQKPKHYEIQKLDRWRGKNLDEPIRCLHDACPDCKGTGRKKNGEMCVHWISCPCPKHTLMLAYE